MRLASLGLAAAVVASIVSDGQPVQSTAAVPHFTPDGALVQPDGFREWVLAGASLGLSYSQPTRGDGVGLFHNVYIERRAFARYKQSGTFPEGTTLVMELFRPGEKADPALGGFYESERVGVEAAVKDSSRFSGGWGYFGFGDGSEKTARDLASAGCAACHRSHAATDNVFTQFYPTLRKEPKR